MIMKKKSIWLLVALGVISLTTCLIYWFFFWPPKPFPSNEQIAKEINRTYKEAGAKVILDPLIVDQHHIAVPYISSSEDYGLSYWGWRNHKWQVLTIDTKGEPKVWKVNGNDPSSFVIVWNIDPEDQLQAIQFYLIRNRFHGMTAEGEYYAPRVQMKKEISLSEKSYGVLHLPKDWAVVLHSLLKEDQERLGQSSLFFNDFFPLQSAYFGWIAYDQSGNEAFPEQSVNGSTYAVGDVYQEYVMILNKVELEIPK